MNGGALIVGQSAHKTYDTGRVKVEALRGVDIAVAKGEMVAVMGLSCCGKSTLLNCLSGLDDIESGAITIAGTDIAQMSDRDETRYRATRMGFIFQSTTSYPC